MKKRLLNYPHDLSKKLLIILIISKIMIDLAILLFFITPFIIYSKLGVTVALKLIS